jgi:hypothetical protein
MPSEKRFAHFSNILATVLFVLWATGAWAGPQYRVLHAFGAGNDGAGLFGGVAFDPAGAALRDD